MDGRCEEVVVRIGLIAFLVAGLLCGACTTQSEGDAVAEATTTTAGPTTSIASTTTLEPPTPTIDSSDTGGGVGTLSAWEGMRATLTVPLDHDAPDGPTVEAPVWRREASDPELRIGVLLVNPGGPGFPARILVENAFAFSRDLRAHFDIIALDPRGTFPGTEVNCFDDYAAFLSSVDWSPDAPGEVETLDAAIQTWVDQCAAEYGDLLPHVSTMDTVHDMALLVEALDEEQVSYFGSSYGSALGAAFVTTYPELVRAAVFDGAYHPYGDRPLEQELASVEAMEALLVSIIQECDASPDCPIQGGAQAAFERVSAAADSDPIGADPSLPVVNQEGFATVIRFDEAAYGGPADRLLAAVAAADTGYPARLQRLYGEAAEVFESGSAALAISCMDYPHRGSTPWPDGALQAIQAAAPTYNAIFPVPELFDPFSIPYECERWPAGPDLFPTPLSGEGAGPVLVVTATGDPITPTASAVLLAEELANSTLLIVEDNQHTSYRALGGNPARNCATDLIDQFLVGLDLPPDGTVCGP